MTRHFKINGTPFADIFDFSDVTSNLKISGRGGDDVIVSGAGADRLDGNKGNDIIFGGGGNDAIDGGKGVDTAVYQGQFHDYSLDFKTNGDLKGTVTDLVPGRDGTDTVKNVEFLRFTDGLYDIANDTFYFSNRAPVVTGAVAAAVAEDGQQSVLNALANASDPDGDPLSVVNVPGSLPAGVSYNASSHSFTLDPSNAAYQHLALGETAIVTVNYGVSDGIVTTAASASWTIAGTNDAPNVAGAVTGAATEDGAISTLNALAAASDIDDNATFSVANVPASLPAGVTYDAASRSFTLDPSDAAYQHLAPGQTATVTVNYGVSDGVATVPASVSWTVTGMYDAPILSGPVTGTVVEDGAPSTLNILANVQGIDDGTMLTASTPTAAAGVTFDAATESLKLDPTNEVFQKLAKGEQTTVTVNYSVTDGSSLIPASAVWTVTGANDAPTLSDMTGGTQQLTQTDLSLNAIMAFADVDLSDSHTVTVSSLTANAIGDASAVIGSDSTGTGQGQINLGYHLTKAQYDAAGGNVPASLDYRITVDDHNGGITSKDISIPLSDILQGGGGGGGGDLSPQITGGTFSVVLTDDQSQATQTASGLINFFDPDSGDTHSVSLISFSSNAISGFVNIHSDTTNANPNGDLQWSYSYDESILKPLGAGETITDFYNIQLSDSAGQFTTTTASVTLAGINDLPQILGTSHMVTFADEFGGGQGSTELHNFGGNYFAGDPDVHDTPTFSLGTPTFSSNESISSTSTYLIDPIFGLDFGAQTVTDTVTLEQALAHNTGNLQQIAGALHMDANGQWSMNLPDYLLDPISQGGVLTLTSKVTVDDHHGGTDSTNLVITLNGTNDAPTSPNPNQDLGTVQTGSGTLHFAGNIAFTDADYFDLHTVSASTISGHLNDPGQLSISVASESQMGGTGAIHWDYTVSVPDSLGTFADATAGFSYSLSDGHDAMNGAVTLAIVDPNHGLLV